MCASIASAGPSKHASALAAAGAEPLIMPVRAWVSVWAVYGPRLRRAFAGARARKVAAEHNVADRDHPPMQGRDPDSSKDAFSTLLERVRARLLWRVYVCVCACGCAWTCVCVSTGVPPVRPAGTRLVNLRVAHGKDAVARVAARGACPRLGQLPPRVIHHQRAAVAMDAVWDPVALAAKPLQPV